MKLSISLATFNDTGLSASIEDAAGFHAVTLLEEASCKDTTKVCLRAAAKLRALADRFDTLAGLPHPLKATTQKKLNRASA